MRSNRALSSAAKQSNAERGNSRVLDNTRFHVVTGVMLAILLTALLPWTSAPLQRLLFDPQNAWAMLALLALHASLLACASFATTPATAENDAEDRC